MVGDVDGFLAESQAARTQQSVVAQLRQCTGARGERVIGDVVT